MANEIRDAFNVTFADGPVDSPSQPQKSDIRPIGGLIQGAVDGLDTRVTAVEGSVGGLPAQIEDLTERVDAAEAIVLSGIKPAKQSVRLLVTTATDPTTMTAGSTLDSLVLAANDRVARATPGGAAADGVYVVQASGPAIRSTDMDTESELVGARFDVDAGSHASETWALQTLAPITVDTTVLTLVKTSSANATTAEVQAARGGQPTLSDALAAILAGGRAEIYETLEDGDFAITDQDDNIIAKFDAERDPSEELLAAGGDRDSLTERLDTSLNAYGLPNEAKPWGEYLLRETRGRLAMMLFGGARQLSIAAIGDSYTQSATRWIQDFTARLKANTDYGDAGPGWCGFGRFTSGTPSTVNGNANPTSYPVTRSGTWTDVYNSSPNSPDRSHNVSSTALSAQRVTGVALPVLSAATLFWIGTADGVMEYRWNDTGAWTTINVQGTVDQLGMGSVATGLPVSGAWVFEVRVVSGTCKPAGAHFASVAKGVTVNKLAGSGAALSQWLVSDNWGAGLAAIAPNLIIIMEGPNSQGNNVLPATWGTNLGTFVDILKAACPYADILIAMPPDNQRVNLYAMPLYAYEAFKVAKAKGCAFLDMQPLFGVSPADYANGSPRPWFDVDQLHPVPATGGRVIGGAVLSIINPY